jgi:anti-anti-sigma factor
MFEVTDNETERIYTVKNDELQFMSILEERILDFVKKDERDVILDLQNLFLFDSVALAVLIRIKRKLAGMDRSFKLINYNQTILRVIELSGLDDFLLG